MLPHIPFYVWLTCVPKVEYVSSFILRLIRNFFQVKSVLDPCGDENDDIQENDLSLGADSVRRDESESDSEVKFLS